MARALVEAAMELAQTFKRKSRRYQQLSPSQAALLELHDEVERLLTERRRLVAIIAGTTDTEPPPSAAGAASVDDWAWCDECRFSHPEGMHD